MILLVTTSQGLIRYDHGAGTVCHLLHHARHCYGLSWTPAGDRMVIACPRGADLEPKFDDLAGYAVSEVGTLLCNGRHSPPLLSAPHQLTCVDETYALVANTGRNALAKVRLDDWTLLNHRFDDVLWDRFDPSGQPGLHLNSVFFLDGVVYAVAHNFQRGSRVFAAAWPALAVRQEWAFPIGGMHNAAVLDGRLVVCDSLSGCLVDAWTGATLWSNGRTGMTRGLAASAEHVFIGHSSFAKRNARANTGGGIWVLDRISLETVRFLPLEGLGGVNEIRIADLPDDCHHGRPLRYVLDGGEERTVCLQTHDAFGKTATRDMHLRGWRIISGSIAATAGFATGMDLVAARGDEGLLLVNMRRDLGNDHEATFDFTAADAEANAALVAGYRGPGDTGMYAGMVRKTPDGMLASIWLEAGGWTCLACVALEEPARAIYGVRLTLRHDEIAMAVDGSDVLRVPLTGEEKDNAGWCGIRINRPGPVVRDFRPSGSGVVAAG
ncbi:MAG: hypothetical protein ACKO9B_04645 [Planctomycetota bacterium]